MKIHYHCMLLSNKYMEQCSFVFVPRRAIHVLTTIIPSANNAHLSCIKDSIDLLLYHKMD